MTLGNARVADSVSVADRRPGASFVFPARDESAAIGTSLRSVAAQDHASPMETALVDGSSDTATATAVLHAVPWVRIVPNRGRVAAAGLNRGHCAQTHPVETRCDARCVPPPGYVQRAPGERAWSVLATVARGLR